MVPVSASERSPDLVIDVHARANPWTALPARSGGERFSFVLIPDRTGNARPGVFERALAVTDLLAPSFAIQMGDLIEGYAPDTSELERQWAEIDELLAGLRTAMFHVPGNHDIATPASLEIWRRRYGRTYFHFRSRDVLFVILNTQEVPQELTAGMLEQRAEVGRLLQADPARARARVERLYDWDGTPPASVTEEQLASIERVLTDHRDARFTVLCMHQPLWQGEHQAWPRIQRALGDRSYTAFAGHIHNYRRETHRGNSHIRLGPAGGLWVLPGPDGNFDHVTHVTVTESGPVICNVLLDGVRDIDGQPL
jgi:serine/threonine-protein phosphatase CPPED1